MRVEQVAIYDGPNRWAKLPLVRMRLDFESPPSDSGEAWNGCFDSLLALLPAIAEPWRAAERAQPEVAGDPALRLALATAVIALQLQREAGPEVRFAQARRLSGDRLLLYDLVYEQEDARAAVPAGRLAARLMLEAALKSRLLPGTPRSDFDPQELIRRFRAAAPNVVLDQTTRAMVRAAERRGIPWRRVDPASRKVQLGHGCRQAHMMETVTSNCTAIASAITGDKSLNNRLLSRLGLPVARHAIVDNPQQALAAARQIGYPLVVKPRGGGQGKGVTVGIETEEALLRAVQEAQRFHKLVMIEGFVFGKDHRLLVVAGRFLAGAQRVPGGVTGDGRHSVAELVEIANRDPRRGLRFQKLMTFIDMNPEAGRVLAAAGLTPESVPEEGQWVALRRTANISTGGTAIDVTEITHQDNRAMAERAAQAVGLDVAGIDFLTPDITRSYREVGGAILEINRSPGLRPHWLANPEQDVVSPILETLFRPGDNGRIPLAAITGTNGKTTTALMVERIFARAGRRVGLASTSGVRLDGHWIADEDLAGYRGHLMVLSAREVEVAVLETARGGIAKRGLGYDRATVGAVLNVTEDHLGLDDIATLDEMAAVKGLVIETASGTAVLNAEDPRCVAMATRSAAERLCYVALDPENPVFAAHVAAGGLGASLHEARGGRFVTLFEGKEVRPLIAVEEIP
ncbi:MAG: Mur ligase family protein, partial [Kiloniellales bacterium]